MRSVTMHQTIVLIAILAAGSAVAATAGLGCGAAKAPAARSGPARVGCGSAIPQSDAEGEGSPKPSCGNAGPMPVPGSARLLSDTGVVEFPFEHVFDYIVVPVSVDGSEPLRLILDTGMPFYGAVLHPNPTTDAIELANTDSVHIVVAGAEGLKPRVGTGVTLALPGVELTDQIVSVIPAPGSCGGKDLLETDGVIGLSIFENFIVEIDQEREILTLTDPDAFTYAGSGQAIPIRLGPVPMPEVTLEIETEDGERVPVSLVVDTGAMYPMSITLGTHEGITLPAGARDMVVGYSSWGEVSGKLGRIDALHLGGYVLDDVLVTFFEKGAPGVPPCGEHGILGNEALARFNVTFDYARKAMYLEPNGRFDEPFDFGMAGFSSKPANDGTREVIRVFPDTPASESDLKEGDRILSVDGVPVRDLEETGYREAFKREGHEVTLGVSRNGREMSITLKLRRLV